MAEYCLECFNLIHSEQYSENEVTLDDDICEGCGKFKPCVVFLEPPALLPQIFSFIKKWWIDRGK